MPLPSVDPTLSFGNLLVVFTLVIGGAIAWAVTDSRSVTSASDIAAVEADYRLLEARVRVLENTISAQTGQLVNIDGNLRDLRQDVKQLLEASK